LPSGVRWPKNGSMTGTVPWGDSHMRRTMAFMPVAALAVTVAATSLSAESVECSDIAAIGRCSVPATPDKASANVARCRDVAAEFGATKVVMLIVDENMGTIEAVSYGLTRRKCAEAKRLADDLYDAAIAHYSRGAAQGGHDAG